MSPGVDLLGLADLVDLVLTRTCAVCRGPEGAVCRPCAAELLASVVAFGPPRAVRPRPAPRGLPVCFASAPYAGPVAALVCAHKDEGRPDVRPVLALLLSSALATALASVPLPVDGPHRRDPLLVVPAPGRRSARRRRGADPLAALADAALALLDTDLSVAGPGGPGRHGGAAPPPGPGADASRPGCPAVVRVARVSVLGHTRAVRDQAGLSAAERRDNLADAVAVGSGTDLTGRSCLLLDDVVTTGTTLAESARAVSRAGGLVIGAATVCATPRTVRPGARLSRGPRLG